MEDRMKSSFLILVIFIGAALMNISAGMPDRPPGKEEVTPSVQQTQLLKKKANRLVLKAYDHYQKVQYTEAIKLLNQALTILETLYPNNQFPDGHPDIVLTLNNLAAIYKEIGKLGEAYAIFEKVLAMDRKLYPRATYPKGHEEIAISLENLGAVVAELGDLVSSRSYREEAYEIYRRLFPEKEYPEGHPSVALALNNLGKVCSDQGDFAAARRFLDKAVSMQERIARSEKTIQSYERLARFINNLARLLNSQGEHDAAEKCLLRALHIANKCFPESDFTSGHPIFPLILGNLGGVHIAKGEYGKSLQFFEKALENERKISSANGSTSAVPNIALCMNNIALAAYYSGDLAKSEEYFRNSLETYRRCYPNNKYPQGHPDIAMTIGNLGAVLYKKNDTESGTRLISESLDMTQRCYPLNAYPYGHPEIVLRLKNFALAKRDMGEYNNSLALLKRALKMNTDLLALFIFSASEAEALNFAAEYEGDAQLYFQVCLKTKGKDHDLYEHIWERKGILHSIMRQRNVLWAKDQLSESLYGQYIRIRRDLSTEALRSDDTVRRKRGEHLEQLQQLSSEKERLERLLAERISGFKERFLESYSLEELIRHLPINAVFIDIYQIWISQDSNGEKGKTNRESIPEYYAFIVQPEKEVHLVRIGSKKQIDELARSWRQEIIEEKEELSGKSLSTFLWQPIASQLSPTTKIVYICPDGQLGLVPWAALSADGKQPIIKGKYNIILVPEGRFLLQAFTAQRSKVRNDEAIFITGDVDYDLGTQEKAVANRNKPAYQSPLLFGRRVLWKGLSGTQSEIEAVEKAATRKKIEKLTRGDATCKRVIEKLQACSWAHIATHGFFAQFPGDPEWKQGEGMQISMGHRKTERVTVSERNPFIFSGLVFAGANAVPALTGSSRSAILGAEAIAALPLDRLELAVLSACESGIGETIDGEGVFGLQRAFHLAGCKNVVASLWKVDDRGTAALMKAFYYFLWTEQLPPAEALKNAQLRLLSHPELVELAERDRSPDFLNILKLPDTVEVKKERFKKKTSTRIWAAFVLSGT
jgi:CHAT domain-containing protein/Tfp pilus assembly protein PilF